MIQGRTVECALLIIALLWALGQFVLYLLWRLRDSINDPLLLIRIRDCQRVVCGCLFLNSVLIMFLLLCLKGSHCFPLGIR